MKTTRDKLIRLCENYLRQKASLDRNIVCAYITGSILKEYPFINGTTDVDIIMIHNDLPYAYREIKPINEETSLDIYHYPKTYFSNTRNLRLDPWLGSSLCFDPIILYGKGHWFEFILASVESTFFLPENVLERVKYFSKIAHKQYNILKGFMNPALINSYAGTYRLCIESAVNSIACLSGPPLTTRRFINDCVEKCEIFSEKQIPEQVIQLISGNDISKFFDYFFNSWKYYIEYFSPYTNENFFSEYNACRLPYYLNTVSGEWKTDLPSAIWLMLSTWVDINRGMRIENCEPFNGFIHSLKLDLCNRNERIIQLDKLLESVDDSIEKWANEKGIENATDLYVDM